MRYAVLSTAACLLFSLFAQVKADDPRLARLPSVDVTPAQQVVELGDTPPDAADPTAGGEVVEGEVVAEPPLPEDEDVLIDPPWYYPSVYFDSECWESSFEFGINGTTGNAETVSFRTGADIKRKKAGHEMAISFGYSRTKADGELTQNNGFFNTQHDWKYDESPWSIFWKGRIEYDEFKAFDYRILTSAGFAYTFIDDDITKLKGRFGPGVSREFGGPDDTYKGEAVWGLDYEKQFTDRQKFEANVEYRPEWDMPEDFLLNTKLSWLIQLDEGGNLSLKATVIDRYDSTPNGAKANDLDYALLLLWKI